MAFARNNTGNGDAQLVVRIKQAQQGHHAHPGALRSALKATNRIVAPYAERSPNGPPPRR